MEQEDVRVDHVGVCGVAVIYAAVVPMPWCNGVGVVAMKGFQTGEPIMVMDGHIVNSDDLERIEYRDGDPLQISANRFVLLDKTPLAVNHSCNPNAGIRPDLTMVAIRPIKMGDEITYDYSTTMLEGEDAWTMECRCGFRWCRKVIGDFTALPRNVQRIYLDIGVVQGFIKDAVI